MTTIARICANKYGAPDAPDHHMFGVEIEVEGVHNQPNRDWEERHNFTTTHDGSLRNAGVEFITNPQDFDDTLESLRKWYLAAAEYGWTRGQRCGIHVHVDMRRYTAEEVAGVCAAYAAFEPLAYAMCGAQREENINCLPWYRAPDQADAVRQMVEQGLGTFLFNTFVKYSGLYCQPLQRFGTIEWRQAPVWDTFDEMHKWLAFIQRTCEWGAEVGAEGVREDLTTKSYAELVDDILGWTAPQGVDPAALFDEADAMSTVLAIAPYTYKAQWRLPVVGQPAESIGYHKRVRREPFCEADAVYHQEVDNDWADDEHYEGEDE
jgi:hypothetical protein